MNNVLKTALAGAAIASVVVCAACEKRTSNSGAAGNSSASGGSTANAGAALPATLIAAAAPVGATDISALRTGGGVKKGDTVTLRGLVGGSVEPFVEGRAVVTIVGAAIKPCNATADDKCTTPWDYCCDTQEEIVANSATVRVVDAQGDPVRAGLKGAGGMKELSDVIVVGTVAEAGEALIVDATSIHVARP